ncbi:MAG: IS256 family transposase [Ignavibacteria bacterium]|jgi:transposase-like protein|nr:IS256 family transposase [Ignavibacteria bacterium]
MELTQEQMEELQKALKNAKTYDDLMGKDGAIKKLLKSSLEQLLESEMTEHLGYEKHSPQGDNSGNSRNGKNKKSVRSSQGEIDLEVPRDRNGKFNPIAVEKNKRTLGDIEDRIISMYAKGISTRDIKSHIEEIYGLELSPASISNITESIAAIVKEWQARPLESIYPIMFLDAIHYKVREDGHVVSKAAYTCLAIDLNGYKEMLGIWIGQAESAKFWMNVLTELRNRGVMDILIACVDGLKGFTEAIKALFPETLIQQCVIHQIRNSLKFVANKDQKEVIKDLKMIYKAPSEESALFELDKMEEKWAKKYPVVIKQWRDNWMGLKTFFEFPEEIRTIIYTTNQVEALHRQFRKVTKAKGQFPSDESLTKMLYLAYKGISKKWTMPVRNWAFVISQLSVTFEERLKSYV